MSAHAALKAATRAAHDQLDAHFSAYDLANREQYGRFLSAHAAAFLPLEQALDDAGARRLLPDWPEHRRGAALAADLTDLGLTLPTAVPAPTFANDDELLGGLYVLEGSRLGGAVLKRAVPGPLPKRFLAAPTDGARWKRFIATLDSLLYAPSSLSRAGTAALATFSCFEKAITVTRR